MNITVEILTMWAAVTLYALAAILFVAGFVFKKQQVSRAAYITALVGMLPHLAAVGGRWSRLGHGPYLGFYEVISSYALFAVVVYVVLAWRLKQLRPLGAVMLPLTFLTLGGAMLAPKSELGVTAALASYWLVIHVTFAKLTYASFITAFGLAVVTLSRELRPDGALAIRLSNLPSQGVIDDMCFRFVAAGFIFLACMIAAGAIWANEAWGRYWGWDPIETWSLISWLIYAVVLHLRVTMGWRGTRFAWAAVIALPINLFAMIGVAMVYNSIHGAYFGVTRP
jgi:cytochrome c-type biogenesis protein CcsB